jgi:hypothetical protein
VKVKVVFDGVPVSPSDKRTVLQGIQKGLQNNKVPFELSATVQGAESTDSAYQFLVFADYEEAASRVFGTASIALIKDDTVLLQSDDVRVTETTARRFFQSVSDKLRDDYRFFQNLANAVK